MCFLSVIFVAVNVVVVVVDKHLINESLQSFHPIIPNKDVLHNNNNYNNDELPIVAWLQNTQFYGFSLISSIIIPIHIYIYTNVHRYPTIEIILVHLNP